MFQIVFLILLVICAIATCTLILPTVPVMFLLTLIYAAATHGQTIGAGPLVLFGSIALLTILIDHLSGLLGAKIGGANKTSMLVGLLGLLLGLFFYPPFGPFIGLFTGVFLAELLQFQNHARALKAAGASLAGVTIGGLVKIGLAVVYVILFAVYVF